MNPWKNTSIYLGAAGLLVVASIFLTWSPASSTAFDDQGEEFYADFRDPLAARTIEVTKWDAELATRVPFKVEQRNGRWVIPSRYDYPADGADTLHRVATQFIGIRKQDIHSDDPSLHESFGVVDPLDDEASGTKGKGTRVVFRDAGGNVLADYIIGKEVENKSSQAQQGGDSARFHYIRVPGKNRTYSAKVNVDIPTQFKDWVETDLLKLNSSEIKQLKFNNYSYDEFRQGFSGIETLRVNKEHSDWVYDGSYDNSTHELKVSKIHDLIRVLDSLRLTNIEPKDQGLIKWFSKEDSGLQPTPDAQEIVDPSNPIKIETDLFGRSLVKGGFYITTRNVENEEKGEIFILANEGELSVQLSNGIVYVLRYGDISVSADAASTGDGEDKESDRYVLVTVHHDPSLDTEPVKPQEPGIPRPAKSGENEDPAPEDAAALAIWKSYDADIKSWEDLHKNWITRSENAKKKAAELSKRFANWYYIISDEDFSKLRLSRSDLIRPIPKVDIMVLGTGEGPEIKKGQKAMMRYTGWLMNADGSQGKEFDSNIGAPEPFKVDFGGTGVIEGWQKGIEGMKAGERRRLIIPPELGYGELGNPPDIPGDATLIFDIELERIEGDASEDAE